MHHLFNHLNLSSIWSVLMSALSGAITVIYHFCISLQSWLWLVFHRGLCVLFVAFVSSCFKLFYFDPVNLTKTKYSSHYEREIDRCCTCSLKKCMLRQSLISPCYKLSSWLITCQFLACSPWCTCCSAGRCGTAAPHPSWRQFDQIFSFQHCKIIILSWIIFVNHEHCWTVMCTFY